MDHISKTRHVTKFFYLEICNAHWWVKSKSTIHVRKMWDVCTSSITHMLKSNFIACAQHISQKPRTANNPLFVYLDHRFHRSTCIVYLRQTKIRSLFMLKYDSDLAPVPCDVYESSLINDFTPKCTTSMNHDLMTCMSHLAESAFFYTHHRIICS